MSEHETPLEQLNPAESTEQPELINVLEQKNKFKWRDNPPKVLRGNIREAFKLGAQAEKMKCDCWNTKCPYYGNCRKCIVFHMSLKQFPTCQRNMLEELYLSDLLDEELHITREPKE